MRYSEPLSSCIEVLCVSIESTSTGGKVGVAGSGRGLVKGGSGFRGDFHVKSLDEIRAEKRRRQQEGSTEWKTAGAMAEEKGK